ncbi:hypothetical protein BDN72DRAFT_862214 [Pluteus cervinus]|uniref:Uncharacterized protein n=1 Tax=Pluteus cervinus TaxID=181527 RepID=A0ACD3ACC2_9AGAR|nr:hypothetical protein BDN72DRAFT_862214 [Pluteus cervinus]
MRFTFYAALALSFVSAAFALPSAGGNAVGIENAIKSLDTQVAAMGSTIQTFNGSVNVAFTIHSDAVELIKALAAAASVVKACLTDRNSKGTSSIADAEGGLIDQELAALAAKVQLVLQGLIDKRRVFGGTSILFSTAPDSPEVVGVRISGVIGLVLADLNSLDASVAVFGDALLILLPPKFHDSCKAIFLSVSIQFKAAIKVYSA